MTPRWYSLRLISAVALLLSFLELRQLSALSPDGLALLAFKAAVDPASTLAEWDDQDDDPCRWPGVSCSAASGHAYPRVVVAVSVVDKNLTGYIPSEFGSLVYLRRLDLHGNFLSGPIPSQLSNATALHSLFLHSNNLSGPVPPSLCNLPRLQNVDLSRNALFGPIPPDLRRCHQLQRLLLAGNRLSGDVPPGIWTELGDLVQLDISCNNLSGAIPSDLGDLRSLTGTLNLSYNQFSGGIPRDLGNLPATARFDLRGNNLSGEIPQAGSLSGQRPSAFLGNPNLCGFPLLNPCQGDDPNGATPGGQSSSTRSGSGKEAKKGLSLVLIVVIAAANAVGVALIGLVLVYAYWKLKDGKHGCSCTGKAKLGGEAGGKPYFCCWTRQSCSGGASSASDEAQESDGTGEEGGDSGDGELVTIDKGFSVELDELLRASAYLLGKGGLGIVYKVVLGNGVPVAVRRLGEGGTPRRREFAAEAQAIGRVKHPNVVRLRAFYWAPDEKLLISDFISHGTLAAALHGKSGKPGALTWSVRLRVARGTARGLAYIHDCSPRKFVHGDIKPSNILLDSDFNPHISDLGLRRLAHIAGGVDAASGGVPGPMGGALPAVKPASGSVDRPNNYRAPEARVSRGRPAQKWDVYSFGVLLLELLTGGPMGAAELVRWVRKGFQEERPLTELLDPALLGAKKEVVSAFRIALECTESDPALRPRMKSVSDNLEKIGR